MARIFLCHASEDKDQVGAIYDRLHDYGFEPWMDKRNLLPGQRWQDEIPESLKRSDFILIFFSRSSVTKRSYLEQEFHLALDSLWGFPRDTIRIIPIRLDDCEIPESFRDFHWIDLPEPGSFERIVQAIELGTEQRTRDHLGRHRARLVLWVGLGVLVVAAVVLARLTWVYTWDVMEPWTYFIGVIGFLLVAAFYILTGHELSPHMISKWIVRIVKPKPEPPSASTRTKTKTTRHRVSYKAFGLLIVVGVITFAVVMQTQRSQLPPMHSVADFSTQVRTIGFKFGLIPINMEFVKIPSGTFIMGTSKEQFDKIVEDGPDSPEKIKDETPQHEVTISQPFYMGKYEVTQAQWKAVMGTNPSRFKGDKRPVESVSWNDARQFIQKLNEREKDKSGLQCRLPTEAEWEYAARAGTMTIFHFGDDPSLLEDYAWHKENSGGQTQPVGEKEPNCWELYDMHGNVWEWVSDGMREYNPQAKIDPKGPDTGVNRILRGGYWGDLAWRARSAIRGWRGRDDHPPYDGFRLACSVPSK